MFILESIFFRYLGLELYYEVALKADGKPLAQEKAEYRTLMKMQEELNKKFQNDMSVLQKKAKENK